MNSANNTCRWLLVAVIHQHLSKLRRHAAKTYPVPRMIRRTSHIWARNMQSRTNTTDSRASPIQTTRSQTKRRPLLPSCCTNLARLSHDAVGDHQGKQCCTCTSSTSIAGTENASWQIDMAESLRHPHFYWEVDHGCSMVRALSNHKALYQQLITKPCPFSITIPGRFHLP